VLSSLFGHAGGGRLNLVIDGSAELASGQYVTGGFFSGLDIPPAAGRLIDQEDDRTGAPPIAAITNDYWHTRFGASPSVVGKHIQINGTSFAIAGVAAPEFYGVSPDSKPSVFLPMANIGLTRPQADGSMFRDGTYYWIELMGRLKTGVTLKQVQAQLAGPFHGFVESTATKDRERADLPSLWLQEGGSGVDSLRRQYSKLRWILMAMVGLILAVACFNIANLLLARAASRRREIALRLSLGAGRFRIIRQLLTESMVLALLSGIAGIGVAALCIRFLLLLLTNGNDNFTVNVHLDWRVLSFTLLIAVVSGIFFGLAPAPQATKVDITPALKETRASESHGKARRLGLRLGFEPGARRRADGHFSPAGGCRRFVRSHDHEFAFGESGLQRREHPDFRS
jgi:predicted permease